MRAILIVSAAFGLMACDALTGGNGISQDDVKNIEPGDAVGVIFTGTWNLETEVTESTCGGLLALLPGTGDKGEDSITFAQSGGSLTRVFDELGDIYEFNGSVNQDGTFTYGQYANLSDGIAYVELVDGRVELNGEGGKATMTGTRQERYQTGIIDCSATVSITGERGSITGGE